MENPHVQWEYIFNWSIFHCHVSLPEGNFKNLRITLTKHTISMMLAGQCTTRFRSPTSPIFSRGKKRCLEGSKPTIVYCIYTPPKINQEPENDGLEDVFPFPGVYSQVPCLSSWVYIMYICFFPERPLFLVKLYKKKHQFLGTFWFFMAPWLSGCLKRWRVEEWEGLLVLVLRYLIYHPKTNSIWKRGCPLEAKNRTWKQTIFHLFLPVLFFNG